MTTTHQIRPYPDNTFRIDVTGSDQRPIERTRDYAILMASTAFDNVKDFPYVYLTNGISEAMDWILPRQRTFADARDYRYAFAYATSYPQAENIDLHYATYPFAADGSWTQLPVDRSVFLDCAYLFASDMTHNRVVPANVEYLAFSLSKSHNLPDYRVGWLMSKKPVIPQHLAQYEFGYGPRWHHDALGAALMRTSNHLYTKYKDYLSDIYRRNDLIESHTNLFALNGKGQRVPYWALLQNP